MALVEFQNGTQPYLNASNLNNNFNELESCLTYKANDWYNFDYSLPARITGSSGTKYLEIRVPINKKLDSNLRVETSNASISSAIIYQGSYNTGTINWSKLTTTYVSLTSNKTAVDITIQITTTGGAYSDLSYNVNSIANVSGSIKFTSTNN